MTTEQNAKVDIVKTLSVFNAILDHGDKLNDGHYIYAGIQARHDLDGYSLTLCDAKVTLNLYFHNKYQVNYNQRSDFESFLHKLDRIFHKLN